MRKSRWNQFLAGASAFALAASLCTAAFPLTSSQTAEAATVVGACQMEALDRGLVAVKSDGGIFLSWRLLGTESYSTTFNVYRNGAKIASSISDSTNYFDASGTTSNSYYVTSVVNGTEVSTSSAVTPWSNQYLDVSINKPADTTLSGSTVTYSANDATVADVDGDGAYEIILKWDPSNSKDNSQSGYTSNVYIDCYEMDGTQLWRIDLGKNIRAGAHYTQMAAYDFDGDGKAELALKTADGTVDGCGNVIGDSSADYRNSSGYILSGPEYLTMFNGQTGEAMTTINYEPARGTVSSWGDSYGNRVDRFLCGVAYLDGETPSLIECRGYYAKSMIVAYKYYNGTLTKQWTFTADSSTNSSYRAQGAHALSIADVDDDGYDEIVYGSAVIDQDGTGLYSTCQGHGDALHCGDFDPDHEGLEIFMVHESTSSSVESVQMRDAKTGTTIWSYKRSADIGRGLIINAAAEFAPYVCLADYAYDSNGNTITSNLKYLGENFSMLWDADLYQEGLDGTSIRKWNSSKQSVDYVLSDSSVHSCNSTKATPTLSGDILGDWREEVIWATSDDSALRIYTTDDVTDSKLYTLVSDRQYREAIAWQNVAYNQPPHTSYYISEDMDTPTQPNIYTVTASGTSTSTEDALEEGVYMLKNAYSGKYMDVEGGVAANNTNIQQWGASGAASYNSWNIVKDSDGNYTIYSLVGDGSTYVMDVAGKKTADGTNVTLYTYKGSDNQKFKLKKLYDGTYAILTKITSFASCVEVADSSTNSGANIQQSAYTGSKSQRWYFEKVADAPVSSATASATTTTTPAVTTTSAVTTTPVVTTTPAVTTTPVVTTTPSASTTPSTQASTQTGSALALDASVSSWSGAYNMTVTLKNTSSTAITDWKIVLSTLEVDMNSIWCAEKSVSGTAITITPASYNAGIAAGGSTSFGGGANGTAPSTLNYTISYEMNGAWYSYSGSDTSL